MRTGTPLRLRGVAWGVVPSDAAGQRWRWVEVDVEFWASVFDCAQARRVDPDRHHRADRCHAMHGAIADTLEGALALAYQNNPQLNAQRAATRATDESVGVALSGVSSDGLGDGPRSAQ